MGRLGLGLVLGPGLGLGLGLALGLQLGIGIGFRHNHSWSSTFMPRHNHVPLILMLHKMSVLMCCQGLSAGLIYLGVWIVVVYGKFEHLSDLFDSSLFPAYVFLAIGVVLFVLGTIGCIGAVRGHRCLVGLVMFYSWPCWKDFNIGTSLLHVILYEIL